MKHNLLARPFAALLMFAGAAFAAAEYQTHDHTHPHPGPVASVLPSLTIPQEFWKQLDVGFVMELEGVAAKSGDVSESDIALATVELAIDADIVDGISGHLGLLWEEDDTEENVLDEGYPVFRYSTLKTTNFGDAIAVSPFISGGLFSKTGCGADLAG